MPRPRHILAPIDFSESSLAALQYGYDLARSLKAKLTVLHVLKLDRVGESLGGMDAIRHLAGAMNLPQGSGSYVPTLLDVREIEKTAQQRLEEQIDPKWRKGLDLQTAIIQGYPSLEIVNYAKEHEADLIVMGTHGRGPVGHLVMGSVAENVIRTAHCPVLTVRRQ